MAKTTRVLAGVAVLAVLIGVYAAAQSGQRPAARRVPPAVVGDETNPAPAVPRQAPSPAASQDAVFIPTFGQAGGAADPSGVHPVVGSWFGKAIQVCPQGVAPSACANGLPAVVLYMTPTLTPDGLFVADDSLTLQSAPFGPHTTAHGSWSATSSTGFTAEYVFMSRPFPPEKDPHISGLRARWVGQVVSADTAVGWVNAYFLSATPSTWTPLLHDEFPAFPSEANAFVTPPGDFIEDPTLCPGDGCPLVFKFTIKRVTK